LHVLGTPPAFVLSQDQTLQFISKNDPFQRKKYENPETVTPILFSKNVFYRFYQNNTNF
jgi:hypothetical protein